MACHDPERLFSLECTAHHCPVPEFVCPDCLQNDYDSRKKSKVPPALLAPAEIDEASQSAGEFSEALGISPKLWERWFADPLIRCNAIRSPARYGAMFGIAAVVVFALGWILVITIVLWLLILSFVAYAIYLGYLAYTVESPDRRRSLIMKAVMPFCIAVFLWCLVPGSKSLPEEITNSIGMKLKLIPAGGFLMGSRDKEAAHQTDEGPQHKVLITKPFYMGVTEVTQGQWFSVMGTKPWSGKEDVAEGDDYPAVYVSWEDAVAYCKKLSTTENNLYRLPTEAEWEYACRGETTTAYSSGSSTEPVKDYVWFHENALDIGEKYAHLVGTKKANPFGLHDMHGNVFEWCSDWYVSDYYGSSPASDPPGATTGSFRVYRSGSWFYPASDSRSANRGRDVPSSRYYDLGFRLVLSPSGQ